MKVVYKEKIFTDSKKVWIVFIHTDLTGKYRNIVDVPKNEMSIHEFDDKRSLSEYMKVINVINVEKMKPQFHYLIVEQNIALSTKYTNRVQELNF